MRGLFATWLALIGFFRLTIHVFGKYFYDRSTKDWPLVEEPRRSLFNGLSQRKKLSQAGAAIRTLRSREFVQRGVADLTQHDLVVVQHRKPEGPSFLVVSFDSMANQRHGLYSPRTGANPRLRVHRLATQIKSFGVSLCANCSV